MTQGRPVSNCTPMHIYFTFSQDLLLFKESKILMVVKYLSLQFIMFLRLFVTQNYLFVTNNNM